MRTPAFVHSIRVEAYVVYKQYAKQKPNAVYKQYAVYKPNAVYKQYAVYKSDAVYKPNAVYKLSTLSMLSAKRSFSYSVYEMDAQAVSALQSSEPLQYCHRLYSYHQP